MILKEFSNYLLSGYAKILEFAQSYDDFPNSGGAAKNSSYATSYDET